VKNACQDKETQIGKVKVVNKRLVRLLAGVVLLLAMGSAANAVPITVDNPSFELPPHGDGGWGPTFAWDLVGPGGGEGGNWNPESHQFTSLPKGNHVGWAYQDFATGVAQGIAQVLGATFAADTEYELTVEVGNSWDYYFSGYAVQLLAGGTVIAEDDNTLHPHWGEWATSTVLYSYDAAHGSLVGDPLEIRLLNLGLDPEGGKMNVEVEFDDVRLTAEATTDLPEPITIALMTIGLAGIGYRRHRSKIAS